MKGISILLLLGIVGVFITVFYFRLKTDNLPGTYQSVTTAPESNVTGKIRKKDNPGSSAIFIPYWSLDTIDESELRIYDRFFYFGVSPNLNGLNQDDLGYLNLETFAELPLENKYLTIRMLDPNINLDVLQDEKVQETIINETLQLLADYSLDGVALDLELTTSLNTDLVGQANKFVQSFYTKLKTKKKRFIVLLFGDSFYRKRPFDVKEISQNSDEIFVMAYDFHKAKGEPGPNFPLSGRSKYGYDFQKMIKDYLTYVPDEKITVIFGMYGYDWTVDEKRRPIKPARALSLNDIKKEFLEKCEWQDCVIRRDDQSAETEINYVKPYESTDLQGTPFYTLDYHIVWFEDKKSVERKIEYLNKKGISKVGYWVYGYF